MVHARTKTAHIRLVTFAFVILAMAVAMTACGNKNNDNPTSNDGIAVTPQSEPSEACAMGVTYQRETWNRTPYAQMNVVPYGHGVRGFRQGHVRNHRYNACGPGLQPMCDTQHGLICMPAQYLTRRNVVYWNAGPNGFGRAYAAYGNIYDRYPNAMGMVCTVGTPSCGPNAVCAQVTPNPMVGVCTQ